METYTPPVFVAPALPTASGALLGALAAFHWTAPAVALDARRVEWLSVAGVVLIFALWWRWARGRSVPTARRPTGWVGAWLLTLLVGASCGHGAATLQETAPAARAPQPDSSRPVAASVQLRGPWRPSPFGWTAPASVVRLTQSRPDGQELVTRAPFRLYIHLPEPELAPPAAGRLHLRGTLRRSMPARNGVDVTPGPWRLAVKSRRLMTVEAPPGFALRISESLRQRMNMAWDQALAGAYGAERRQGHSGGLIHGHGGGRKSSGGVAVSPRDSHGEIAVPPGLALTRALVLGDPSQLPDSWRRTMRRTGLAHLTAVSGLHVGLLLLLTLGAGAWLPRVPRLLLTIPPLVIYLLLVGPRPSLLRAAVMGALAVASLLLKRPPGTAQALSLFVLGAVALAPALVLDLGFQLSVAATAGMVVLAPLCARRWSTDKAGATPRERRRRGLRNSGGPSSSTFEPSRAVDAVPLLTPRWAQPLAAALLTPIATWPIALPAFHLLPVASPLLNLVFVPWTAVCLVAGLLWSFLALLSPPLAGATLPLLDALTLPFGLLAVAPVTGLDALPVALATGPATALTAGFILLALYPRRLAGYALLVSLLLLQPTSPYVLPPTSGPLEVTFLDVGQGDSILFRDGPRALLVDGGGRLSGDLGGRVLVPALAFRGLRRLETVVLTHPDRDHCGGLADLTHYLPVRRVASAPRHLPSPCLQRLLGTAPTPLELPSRRRPFLPLLPETRLRLGRFHLRVLHPSVTATSARDNNASVVLHVTAPTTALPPGGFLLTGDIEASAEAALLRREPDLNAAILHIPHHGSKTSTTPSLLDTVAPRWAVISAGLGNPYGHPHPQTLERLRSRRISLLRTDRDGAITLRVGKGGMWIHVEDPGKE